MKISAGMIVFQAESVLPPGMLALCIESMLPHVDEFIVVEGAVCAKQGHRWDGNSCPFATKLGHSTDNTLSILNNLTKQYSPKLKLITQNGFWNGKTSMCNAYSKAATGDYLWHVDSDEFYHENDILKIKQLLEEKRPDAVHFYAHHFYGDFNHVVQDGEGPNKWVNIEPWRRIFKHRPGYSWKTHEPPNYLDDKGTPLNEGNIITRDDTRDLDLYLYHYSQVCRTQVEFKSVYFNRPEYVPLFNNWTADHKTKLIGLTQTIPFEGKHPKIIQENYLS